VIGNPASQATHEARILYRLTDRLYRSRSPDDVYEAALDAIVGSLGCARASILLFDENNVMRFVAWRGLSDAYRHRLEGHTPWKRGERDPHPLFISNIEESYEADWVKVAAKKEGIRSLAYIPLVAQGGTVGQFMACYEAPRIFSDHQIELAITIARQVGFSIERSAAEDARRRAEEHQELLVAELHHRVKNTLAVVQAIAHQTFRGAPNEWLKAFTGRLQGLARSHDLLFRAQWMEISLHDLAKCLLPIEPGKDRFAMHGPPVLLDADHAIAIGMALHELFTNAIKYGALSDPEGAVTLEWRWTGQPQARLEISWREQGGPRVKRPSRTGFGSLLLERTIQRDLAGNLSLDYRPDGLCCAMTVAIADQRP
jgi:two-component sensor histidine kinase